MSTTIWTAALAAGTLALATGCGARRAGAPDGARPSSNVILADEMERVPGNSVYDAVATLRPQWFRRNPTMVRPDVEGDIVVYLDRTRLGGPAALRQIPIREVVTVRYYSPSEAAGEFGPGHLHGAIQVTTRR